MHIEKEYGNRLVNAILLPVLLLILAFAGLAPTTAVAQHADVPENHQATATAEQEMKQRVDGILATITQSGSTNTRGYKVVIYNDGSATAEIGGASIALRTVPSRSQLSFWNDRYKDATAPAYRDWGCQQDPNGRLCEIGLLRNAHSDYVCEQNEWRLAMYPAASIRHRSGATPSIRRLG